MGSTLYNPLDPATREIRLLLVRPAGPNDRECIVEASLFKCRLKDAGNYYTLSYAWGNPEPTRPILLEGKRFEVRTNLHDALLQFRRLDGLLVIWIDALCINQDDKEERASQVTFMCDIYSKAQRTFAWLGLDSVDIDAKNTFAFLRQRALEELEDLCNMDSSRTPIAKLEMIDCIEKAASETAQGEALLKLAHLLASRWFSRMWIIQEVVMSSEVSVCCGSYTIEWVFLLLAAHCCRRRGSELIPAMSKIARSGRQTETFGDLMLFLIKSVHNIVYIGNLRRVKSKLGTIPIDQSQKHVPTSVYEIVSCASQFDVTEPFDRVYSLLGLFAEYKQPMWYPSVSYTITLADLYRDMFNDYVQIRKNLDFLSSAIGIRRPSDEGISSWMPHWSCSHDAREDIAIPIAELDPAPVITIKAMADTSPFCYFSPRLKTLNVAGFDYDTVSRVGDVLKTDRESPDASSKGFIDAVKSWRVMLQGFLVDLPAFTLNVDTKVPSSKQDRFLSFLAAITMIDDYHNWSDEQLLTLEKETAQNLGLDFVISPDDPIGARDLCAALNRRLFITQTGHIGLGQDTTAPDDRIVFFYGCNVPMLLRAVRGRNTWEVVGEAFVPGCMSGQLLRDDMRTARRLRGNFDRFFALV